MTCACGGVCLLLFEEMIVERRVMTGHHYTLGAMRHSCGDRSWIGHIWKVLETNGSAALIIDPFARGQHSFGRHPMTVSIAEFDWTPADEMAEIMAKESAQ